jgi:ferredoxin/flavodoxin---NADP+ reductase
MNKIVMKRQLADEVYRIEVEAPHIAHERKAGQFVIVQTDTSNGESVFP